MSFRDEMEKFDPNEQNEMWEPEEGDWIVGKYTNVKHNVGRNDSDVFTFSVIEAEDPSLEGRKLDHWGRSVLKSEMKENEIEVGDTIGIKYGGKQEGGSYGSYHVYGVKVMEREESANNEPLDYSKETAISDIEGSLDQLEVKDRQFLNFLKDNEDLHESTKDWRDAPDDILMEYSSHDKFQEEIEGEQIWKLIDEEPPF